MAVAIGNPGLINLAAGFVDPLTLPVEPVKQITQRIFSDISRGRAALQYDTTQGVALLRQACLRHLEKLENMSAGAMGLTADHLLVTTGSQQALYLIGEVLINPGDIVIAANPCYFVYTATLSSLGATVLTVPMDDAGIDVDAIEKLLTRLEREGRLDRVKLIYTTSYFQNPTGLSLSSDRRKQLLELAKKFSRQNRILILEDAAYRELRYDGPALPSMKPLDAANQFIILTQTFSKPFAPGLKSGYTAMPGDILQAVLRQKGNHDFGSASLTQHIALEAMTSGLYAEQVDLLRQSYARKRDAMLKSLDRHMPKAPGATPGIHTPGIHTPGITSTGISATGITWTKPSGGLYIWLTLPPQIDTSASSAMFTRCVEAGVLYVPGDYCFQPDANGFVPKNHLRLSFGQVAPDQVEPGIARLATVVASLLNRAPMSINADAIEMKETAIKGEAAIKGDGSL
jgi:2-aminoadipate transaminase